MIHICWNSVLLAITDYVLLYDRDPNAGSNGRRLTAPAMVHGRAVIYQAAWDLGDVKEAGYTALVEKYLKFRRIRSAKSHAGVRFMPV